MTLVRRLAALSLALALTLAAPVGVEPSVRALSQSGPAPDPAPGAILAPLGRQVGWLNLDAPRPRVIFSLLLPDYPSGVTVSPSEQAVVTVQSRSPLDNSTFGGDLLALDLRSGAVAPLVMRTTATESIGAPAWQADGARILFQRQDLSQPPLSLRGRANVSYPTQVEAARADGSGRAVLVLDALEPAPSPDGTRFAFLRSSPHGTALLVRSLVSDDPALTEFEAVPAARFPDLAYPRYSPSGDQIAFMATAPIVVGFAPPVLGLGVAYAHGLPWNLWLVRPDGSDLRQVAQLSGDDASVAWSPDGGQLFVYGGSGSYIVDVATGDIAGYAYITGYGATAWIALR